MIVLSIFAAVIPALLYALLIYAFDRYEKEPLWLLAATFIWGAIPAVITALIFNALFGLPFYLVLGENGSSEAAVATFVAPLVEESAKGVALLLVLFFWRSQIDSLLDGIIYGSMIGIGFAMVENIFYFVTVFDEGGFEAWQSTFILRVIIFGFNHALFTSMTGLGIAVVRIYRDDPLRFLAPVAGWSVAVVLHFIHNASASLGDTLGGLVCLPMLGNAWGGGLITVAIMIWSLVQERRWLQTYLRDEVHNGLITIRQYEIATSSWRRIGAHIDLFSSRGIRGYTRSVRFYDRLSKLAYLKHHEDWYHDPRTLEQMGRLREEIAGYRQFLA